MGLVCSDGKKRAKNMQSMNHFSSHFEEVSESNCSSYIHPNVIQNRHFKRWERKNVSSHMNPARLKYKKEKLKTTYLEKKLSTSADRCRTRQTLTISKLKIKSHGACERIGFNEGREYFGRKPEYCDHDTPDWSPTCSETENGNFVLPISRRTSKRNSRKMKWETIVISGSPRSITKGLRLRAKHYKAETDESKTITNSIFSPGNASNIKLSEIAALGEYRSLVAPEPKTQLVKDERDNILSGYPSYLFSALENNKLQQKERSNILYDISDVSGLTSLKTERRNSEKIPLKDVYYEDAKHDSIGTCGLNSGGHPETRIDTTICS